MIANKVLEYYENLSSNRINKNDSSVKCLNIIPCANLQGLRNHSREYVVPEQKINDINRVWTTNAVKSNNVIRSEIKKCATMSDIVIDMHCSPSINSGFLLDSNQPYLIEIIDWCKRNNINCFVRDSIGDTIKRYEDISFDDKIHVGLTWEQCGLQSSTISIDDVDRMSTYFINNIVEKLNDLYETIISSNRINKKSTKYTKSENKLINKYRMKIFGAPTTWFISTKVFVKRCLSSFTSPNKTKIGVILKDDEQYVDVILPPNHVIQTLSGVNYIDEHSIIAYVVDLTEEIDDDKS